MKSYKNIGGYLGLEIDSRHLHYHKNVLRLNTGRNALEYILKSNQVRKLYIPYYLCSVLLEPLNKNGIPYEYYHINEDFEPVGQFDLKESEYLLYINYFGINSKHTRKILNFYENVIIDNSQAFFELLPQDTVWFNSARKFFGVPDGAYLNSAKRIETEIPQDISYLRTNHLMSQIDVSTEFGYEYFQKNEQLLCNQPIMEMSKLTSALLGSIDYATVAERRIANFNYIHNTLKATNLLNVAAVENDVPLCYPFLVASPEKAREKCLKNKIYLPTFWHNVFETNKPSSVEWRMASILPLPIDQRYNFEDMNRILEVLN